MSSFIESIWDADTTRVRDQLQADPSLANTLYEDMSPLHWACRPAQPNVVRTLLEFGADPNKSTDDAESPLHLAAFEGCDESVQHLLQGGAIVDAVTEDGKTPLMNAAQAESPSVVQLLLAAGADPLKRDIAGRTCLHWAAVGTLDDGSLIRILLSANADPRVQNTVGDTAFDYAQAMNKPIMAKELTIR